MLRTIRAARPDPLRFRPTLESLDDRAVPSGFRQANLVADEPGVAAIHDPALVNGWGIALSPAGGAFWVSANGTGTSPLYTGDVAGKPIGKAFNVSIPGGAPTGQVFNGSADFAVTAGGASKPAVFIFAGQTGFVTGWNPAVPPPPLSTTAQVAVARPGAASYTGVTIAATPAGNHLFAADFQNGRIDVFDNKYAPVSAAGTFTDPDVPDRYAPFNIQALGGKLYVTYARKDKDGGLHHGGNGFVSVFNTDGTLVKQLVRNDHLKAPWGLAIAPAGFGEFGGALLVGNHGDGRINAYDPATGEHLGRLRDERGRPVRIDGLYGLAFGNGKTAGDSNALYFAAGPNDGRDGLFGSLRFVAETGGQKVSVAGLSAAARESGAVLDAGIRAAVVRPDAGAANADRPPADRSEAPAGELRRTADTPALSDPVFDADLGGVWIG